jgi:hypothetical protein
MWSYTPQVSEDQPLERHIEELWGKLIVHKEYLKQLKTRTTVDVLLGYSSNSDHSGFSVPHNALEMFMELEIPFEVSVIIP